MKPVIMAALVETYAVLGLLITILLLNGINL
jgi:F0F1-type ATP synthase membrane subunit c/vacuolar-type H+-ATPase subunit K